MTEAEWLKCAEPEAMLEFLQSKVSERKLRLFGCACCERIWELVTDARSRRAINTLRQFADGRASEEEMENEILEAQTAAGAAEFSVWVAIVGHDEADRASRMMGRPGAGLGPRAAEVEAAVAVDVSTHAHRAADLAARCVWGARPNFAPTTRFVSWAAISAARATNENTERTAQRSLIEDIFGNPFRPVTFSPEWRTGTAVSLAQQMYESRDFGAMPILADALQDAGCDSADVPDHCRGGGSHVRGCWVVDLVLGKA